jgi:hypothetical protein
MESRSTRSWRSEVRHVQQGTLPGLHNPYARYTRRFATIQHIVKSLRGAAPLRSGGRYRRLEESNYLIEGSPLYA